MMRRAASASAEMTSRYLCDPGGDHGAQLVRPGGRLHRRRLLERIARQVGPGVRGLDDAPLDPSRERPEDVPLVREVLVHRRARDLRTAGDVGDRGAVEPLVGDHCQRGIQDPIPSRLGTLGEMVLAGFPFSHLAWTTQTDMSVYLPLRRSRGWCQAKRGSGRPGGITMTAVAAPARASRCASPKNTKAAISPAHGVAVERRCVLAVERVHDDLLEAADQESRDGLGVTWPRPPAFLRRLDIPGQDADEVIVDAPQRVVHQAIVAPGETNHQPCGVAVGHDRLEDA